MFLTSSSTTPSWFESFLEEEFTEYTFYFDSPALIDNLLSKDREISEKQGRKNLSSSRLSKKFSSSVTPNSCTLRERLIEDCLYVGSIAVHLTLTDGDDYVGYPLLVVEVEDVERCTLERLRKIPVSTTTVLAITYNASESDLATIHAAMQGSYATWRLQSLIRFKLIRTEEYETFLDAARAALTIHILECDE